jgi:hypothetical protein
MIHDLPYGPIRPCDIDTFYYNAGAKWGELRSSKYKCFFPEGIPKREPSKWDDYKTPWEEYIEQISDKEVPPTS